MMEYAGQNIHTQRCLAGKQLNPKQCFCQDETPSPVPQSPTVIANAPCGCKVNGFNDKIGWHMEIAYCKLHASASPMLELLKNYKELIEEEFEMFDGSIGGGMGKNYKKVCNLLASLGGSKNE